VSSVISSEPCSRVVKNSLSNSWTLLDTMSIKKNFKYYLGLNWSFTVEQEVSKGYRYFVVRVKELPGVCTDAESIEEGMILIQEAIEASVKLYLKNGAMAPEPVP
jgi:predicted RNase H-like HicB family nuclease